MLALVKPFSFVKEYSDSGLFMVNVAKMAVVERGLKNESINKIEADNCWNPKFTGFQRRALI
jgi:hypothetical protein